MNNIERFKQDLEHLVTNGDLIHKMMLKVYLSEKPTNDDLDEIRIDYELWFSEANEVVKQLLPERAINFKEIYSSSKERERFDFENYTIRDALIGMHVRNSWDKVIAAPKAAIPRFIQQLGILKACMRKLESSLLNVRKILSADLFENELDAAEELKKNGFTRAAGAIAGVVLEGHLIHLCENNNIKTKKNPGIHELNKLLLDNEVYEASDYNKIDYLRKIRNQCDHSNKSEPTVEDIDDLIKGVTKIIKMNS